LAARVCALLGNHRRTAAGGGRRAELLEILAGYEFAVVIDAICGGGGEVGTLYRLDQDGMATPLPGATHAIGLLEAMELGRRLGFAMPRRLVVYASRWRPFTFDTALSPAVAAALPRLAARIANAVARLLRPAQPRRPRPPAGLPRGVPARASPAPPPHNSGAVAERGRRCGGPCPK